MRNVNGLGDCPHFAPEVHMEFTADWFSRHTPVWSRLLGPLTGQPLQALEVGSYEGRSAVWLLQNILTHSESQLTCVDMWDSAEVQRRFRSNIAETGRGEQVIECVGESQVALRSVQGTFDLIYIDGSHEARDILVDAALCWSLLKPGGLLLFDDYGWDGPVEFPPRHAIDVFLQLWMTQIEVWHKGYQVIVRRRM